MRGATFARAATKFWPGPEELLRPYAIHPDRPQRAEVDRHGVGGADHHRGVSRAHGVQVARAQSRSPAADRQQAPRHSRRPRRHVREQVGVAGEVGASRPLDDVAERLGAPAPGQHMSSIVVVSGNCSNLHRAESQRFARADFHQLAGLEQPQCPDRPQRALRQQHLGAGRHPQQRPNVQMVAVQVRDQHDVCRQRGDRRSGAAPAAKMPDEWSEDRIGQHPHAGILDGDCCVPPPADVRHPAS